MMYTNPLLIVQAIYSTFKAKLYITVPEGKDFANYKDEALEIYPTIVYACKTVF